MKTPLKTSIAFLWLVLVACTYEPEETYFKEIARTDPNVDIWLNAQADNDTIQIYQATEFSYQVTLDRGSIRELQVLLDKQTISTNNTKSGKFSISPQNVTTGVHELMIRFVSTSGTGSLADKLNAEHYEIWRKWTLMVDFDPPPKPVVKLSSENGLLKLTWSEYTKPNFVSYTINSSQGSYYRKNVKITDPHQTSWIDSSYTGGTSAVTYVVYTRNSQAGASAEVEVNEPIIFDVIYTPFDSTAVVKWQKPRFFGAVKEYLIEENGTEKFRITNLDDTTVTYRPELVFRASVTIQLKIMPRYSSPYAGLQLFKTVLEMAGEEIDYGPDQLFFNADINSIIALKYSSPRQLVTLDSDMNESPLISLAGDHALTIPFSGSKIYHTEKNTIYQYDLITQQGKTYVVTPYVSSISRLAASGNEIIAYSTYNAPSTLNPLRRYGAVYHFGTNATIVAQNNNSDKAYTDELSSNGKYIYRSMSGSRTSGTFYEIKNDNSLQTIGTLTSGSFRGFRPDDNEEMFVSTSTGMALYHSSNLTLKRTIPAPTGYGFNSYDAITKHILFLKPNAKVQYLMHIDTEVIKPVNAYYVTDMSYKLLNGTLFSNGYYLKVL